MRSLLPCIRAARTQGKLTPEQASAMEADLRGLAAYAMQQGASPEDAMLWGSHRLLDQEQARAHEARRRAKLQEDAWAVLQDAGELFRNRAGNPDLGEFSLAVMEHHGWHRGRARLSSVQGRQQAIVGLALSQLDEAFVKLAPATGGALGAAWTGRRAALRDIVTELFGADSGAPEAKRAAQSFSAVAEMLRERYNQAGGAIGKLENWGLPQHHNARKLLNAGFDTWRADIERGLDWSAMTDHETGLPILPWRRESLLRDAWEAIVSNGRIGRDPGKLGFGTSWANRRSHHRFFKFANADAWMAYEDKYGDNDAYMAMVAHIRGMARDIAAMEILGPNPQASIERLSQWVAREGDLRQTGHASARIPDAPLGAARYASQKMARLNSMWEKYQGATAPPADGLVADLADTARNLVTANALGSTAILAAGTDPMLGGIARKMAGLPASATIGQYLAQLNPADPTHREAARQAGAINDAMLAHLNDSHWVGQFGGSRWSGIVADNVLRVSGLTALTQAGKSGFHLAMMHELAAQAGKDWARLPPDLRATMERYGISDADWNVIRTVPAWDGAGVPIIRPRDIPDVRLAERLLEMTLMHGELATPQNSLRAASFFGAHLLQQGTALNVAAQSIWHLKTFPAMMVMQWGYRLFEIFHRTVEQEGLPRGLAVGTAWTLTLLGLTTMGAAVSMQLQEIAKGRDPRPMNDEQFWLAAMSKGGGLGFYSDFLIASQNEYGHGLASTAAGPIWDRVGQFLGLTIGNLTQAGLGEETDAGKELVTFLKSTLPGTSLWYLRLATERLFFDALQAQIDPDAAAAFARRVQWYERETGQRFYWAPGTPAPARAPDPAAALP